jgi:nucleoporin GLE1
MPNQNLKAGPMKTVKGNQSLKSKWSAIRRQITPKIGQLTHDIDSVTRIVSLSAIILSPGAEVFRLNNS